VISMIFLVTDLFLYFLREISSSPRPHGCLAPSLTTQPLPLLSDGSFNAQRFGMCLQISLI